MRQKLRYGIFDILGKIGVREGNDTIGYTLPISSHIWVLLIERQSNSPNLLFLIGPVPRMPKIDWTYPNLGHAPSQSILTCDPDDRSSYLK